MVPFTDRPFGGGSSELEVGNSPPFGSEEEVGAMFFLGQSTATTKLNGADLSFLFRGLCDHLSFIPSLLALYPHWGPI